MQYEHKSLRVNIRIGALELESVFPISAGGILLYWYLRKRPGHHIIIVILGLVALAVDTLLLL